MFLAILPLITSTSSLTSSNIVIHKLRSRFVADRR